MGSKSDTPRTHRKNPVHGERKNNGAAARLHQEVSPHPGKRPAAGTSADEGDLPLTGSGPAISRHEHLGSSLEDFLQEEGILAETTAVAVKRVIAWQIAQEMKAQNLTKTTLAHKMHTSRAALNRLLDEDDTSLTLTTLASVASALGKKIRLELVPG